MISVKQLVARSDDATHPLPGTRSQRPILEVESLWVLAHLSLAPDAYATVRSIGNTT